MAKPDWMFDKSKIPIGGDNHHASGQQWAYQKGYEDGQLKLLDYLIAKYKSEGIDWLREVTQMKSQLEKER